MKGIGVLCARQPAIAVRADQRRNDRIAAGQHSTRTGIVGWLHPAILDRCAARNADVAPMHLRTTVRRAERAKKTLEIAKGTSRLAISKAS